MEKPITYATAFNMSVDQIIALIRSLPNGRNALRLMPGGRYEPVLGRGERYINDDRPTKIDYVRALLKLAGEEEGGDSRREILIDRNIEDFSESNRRQVEEAGTGTKPPPKSFYSKAMEYLSPPKSATDRSQPPPPQVKPFVQTIDINAPHELDEKGVEEEFILPKPTGPLFGVAAPTPSVAPTPQQPSKIIPPALAPQAKPAAPPPPKTMFGVQPFQSQKPLETMTKVNPPAAIPKTPLFGPPPKPGIPLQGTIPKPSAGFVPFVSQHQPYVQKPLVVPKEKVAIPASVQTKEALDIQKEPEVIQLEKPAQPLPAAMEQPVEQQPTAAMERPAAQESTAVLQQPAAHESTAAEAPTVAEIPGKAKTQPDLKKIFGDRVYKSHDNIYDFLRAAGVSIENEPTLKHLVKK